MPIVWRRRVLRSRWDCFLPWAWYWRSRFEPTVTSLRLRARPVMGLPAARPIWKAALPVEVIGSFAPGDAAAIEVTPGRRLKS